ncbi:hypothetical protein [Pedobacter sp. NJ-S-72]
MLYGQAAEIEGAKNNFIAASQLNPDQMTGNSGLGYTQSVVLLNTAVTAGNTSLNMASFNVLIYQGNAYQYTLEQQGSVGDPEMSQAIFFLMMCLTCLMPLHY